MNRSKTQWQTAWLAGFCLAALGSLAARELNPVRWTLAGPHAAALPLAVDNDPATVWDSGAPQTPGTAVLIDLGRPVYVYRVFLTPGREVSRLPRSLNVYVGETPETLLRVAGEASIPGGDKAGGLDEPRYHRESNFVFDPAWGRYVKIELGDNTAGQSWAIAEMSIHGATRKIPESDWLTVLMDNPPEPVPAKDTAGRQLLSSVSRDFQYYLMELLDQPVRLTTTANLPPGGKGLRLRLVTPPEAPALYPEANPRNLDDVSVTRTNNEIFFAGLTPRAVAYSVYEFLYRQGVRWVYPDTCGDFVPEKKKLDLSVLPISYRPPFTVRDLGTARFDGVPYWPKTEQASLFFLRNGLNVIGDPRLGTPPRKNMNGTFHTMAQIFTPAVEKAHPEWWPGPYRLEKGSNAEPGGSGRTPCTSLPEVRDFILEWMEKDHQLRLAKHLPLLQGYSVMPLDSAVFCECPRCVKMFGKGERLDPDKGEEYWNINYSDHYFHLINELARTLQHTHPEWFLWACAYAQYRNPPKRIDRLPDNVMVDVCVYGGLDLPPSSPANRVHRELMEDWSRRCRSLGMVDYALMHVDTTYSIPDRDIRTFEPLLRSVCEWKQFQNRIGVTAVAGFPMGDQRVLPWAMYAWARAAWRPDEPAETIARDFFTGYYGPAAGPHMQRLYQAVEQALCDGNIRFPYVRWCDPAPELFTDELLATVRPLGELARAVARTWYEKERVATALDSLEWSWRVSHRGYDGRRTYPCFRVAQPPSTAGRLDDAAWSSLPVQKGFAITPLLVAFQNQGLWAVKRPTQFRMGWDETNLYLAVECLEPEMEKVQALGRPPADLAKAGEAIDVIWAPGGPPRFNSRFNLFGVSPANWSDACRIATNADRWIVQARFPLKIVCNGLPDSLPRAGHRWPFNVQRWSSQESDEDTWRMSSWAPAGNISQGFWMDQIEFQGRTLSADEAAAQTAELNGAVDAYAQRWAAHQEAVAAFDRRVEHKPNLFAREEGTRIAPALPVRWYNNSRDPIRVELRRRTPAAVDAVRITWNNRGQIREWYSLEWWDGERYRLLAEIRDNAFYIDSHEFDAVATDRLRITIWGDRNGNTDGVHSTLIKNIEAFKR